MDKKIATPKKPSVNIVVPSSRYSMHPECAMSLFENFMDLIAHGYGVVFKFMASSSFISATRNMCAVDLKQDYLMFVDDDEKFPPYAIRQLLEANKDIIGGLYYKKGDDFNPMAVVISQEKMNIDYVKDIPTKPFLCDGVNTGFLLIKKKVFEAFTPDKVKELGMPFNFWTRPSDGREISEDWAFCMRASKLGFKIWCDPTFPIGHMGDKEYTRTDYESKRQYQEFVDKNIEYRNNIEGWMKPVELDWLYKAAKGMQTIVEIGSWKGKSTAALCSACKGTVYSVDTFKGSASEKEEHAEAKQRDIYQDFKANTKQFKNLVSYKMTSLKASKKFKDKSVDMVFIDGEHTYEAVKQDIELWLPKCKKLICGHDYNYNDVAQAVNQKFGYVDTAECIWIKNIV
jgi:precorrin-6B methylase 2